MLYNDPVLTTVVDTIVELVLREDVKSKYY